MHPLGVHPKGLRVQWRLKMPRPSPNTVHLILLAGILAAVAAVGLWLQPATINGDGVGYLKQLRAQGLSPGHLLYLPLIRALAGTQGTLLEAVPLLRGLSLACALATLLFFWDAARRVAGPGGALLAVALLASSHAFLRSALEVEVYQVATLACVITLWALIRGAAGGLAWGALAGVAAGVAAGFHSTLVLLAPALILAPRRHRWRRGAVAACLSAGLVLALILLWAASAQGLTSAGEVWRWLRSADHGVPYPHGWRTVPATLWGVARSLVHVPYPHQAPLWWVVLSTALATASWAGVLLLGRGQSRPCQRLTLAWTIPLALFGLAFYPSDTERWIFVLPALLLTLAPRPGRLAWGLVAAVALFNLASYQVPASLDNQDPNRAAAAEAVLKRGDLLISPGHGWEELVGLGSLHPAELFPLIHFVGASRGVGAAVVLMWRRMQAVHAAGGKVYVARLKGSADARGFKELAWFDVSRADFLSMFDLYAAEPTGVQELWRIRVTSEAPALDLFGDESRAP